MAPFLRSPQKVRDPHVGSRNGTGTGSICFDYARIDRETLAAHEPFVYASLKYPLEHMPECIALAKTPVPDLRERGMFRYRVLDPQPTKPELGQVQMHFFAQPTLRTDP